MAKRNVKKEMIAADKISGLEAVAFVVSVLVPVVADHNRRVKFKFPFWAFSVPAGSYHGTEWIDEAAYGRWSDKILKSIQKPGGLAYFSKIKKRVIIEEAKFEKMSRKLRYRLDAYSDQDLAAQHEKFIKTYSYYYGLGVITFLFESILSERLMSSLAKRYPDAVASLPLLLKSGYTSFMLSSEKALLQIKYAKPASRRRLLARYQEDFFYIRANYGQAPPVDEKFVLDRVKHLSRHKDKTVASRRIKLEAWERNLIKLLKISEVIRDKRKQLNIIGSYMMFRFLEEAARRRRIPVKTAARAFCFEYRDLLSKTDSFLPILQKRQEFSVIYDHGRCLYFDYIALQERTAGTTGARELVGTPAAGGVYRGLVRKIMTGRDFSKFHEGEVLVTTMTRPEFLPVMKKAAAIVTDEGGLTCHAAIVARELGIPCIVGTRRGTKILRDGCLVEVDAEKGIVKILRRA